jgi:hypothetical protein
MTRTRLLAKVEFVEFDLPWLAGFFDGEGSVGIYDRNANKEKTIRYYVLVVSLAQSGPIGKKILEECQKRYGGSVYQNKSNKTQTLNKIMWKWNVSADKAEQFLQEIVPHCFVKSQQIRLCLDFQKLPTKRWDNITAKKLAELVKDLKQ